MMRLPLQGWFLLAQLTVKLPESRPSAGVGANMYNMANVGLPVATDGRKTLDTVCREIRSRTHTYACCQRVQLFSAAWQDEGLTVTGVCGEDDMASYLS